MTSLTDLMEFSSIMYESGVTSLMETHGDSVPLCMGVV